MEMETAVKQRFEELDQRAGGLLASKEHYVDYAGFNAWAIDVLSLLQRALGAECLYYKSFNDLYEGCRSFGATHEDARACRELLQSATKEYDWRVAEGSLVSGVGTKGQKHQVKVKEQSRVFIVHGHDEALKHETARFLAVIGLEPIILFEQPGKGLTIIEKLEQSSRVDFAVVLLTPDDVCKATNKEGDSRSRARQNVVFELGYFLAKLGRSNVAALYQEGVELPSDYRGVEYVKVDAEGAWKMKLARELQAAGLPVDMNKAI